MNEIMSSFQTSSKPGKPQLHLEVCTQVIKTQGKEGESIPKVRAATPLGRREVIEYGVLGGLLRD